MTSWLLTLRTLGRRPAYALTTVLVLGLGIGATATLFSVVDTVLLQPLPYLNADRLVTVLEANPSKRENASLIAPGRLQDWNQMSQAFVSPLGIAGAYAENETDTSGAEPERLSGLRVSPGYFGVFGTPPLLGHTFTAAEDTATSAGAAVISDNFWARRYGRDRGALGRRLILGGVGYTIVGVMPASFTSSALDVWLPAKLSPFLMTQREARFYSGVGRMRPGVTIAQAQADLARVEVQLGRRYPASDAGWSALVGSLKEFRVGGYRDSIWLVFAAVTLLLLLAVANIGGLTLAQLQGRARELAIRSAIGASRAQLVATIMREAALLAALGTAAGGALAWLGVRAIAATAPGTLPRMAELRFDPRGWAFAAAISALAALGFGLAPALATTRAYSRTTRGPKAGSLLATLNAGTLGGRRRLQQVLVVGQLAVTVLLLASANLLLRSYYNLSHVTTGFDAANVFTFHIGAGWNEDRNQIGGLQTRLVDQLQQLPGVRAAGITNFLPASNATLQYQIQLAGLAGSQPSGTDSVGERIVSTGYLQALRVPLLAGSWCPALHTDFNAPTKALVNRSFVDTYLRGESVVGREFRFASEPPNSTPSEIVGVVGDVRENNLATPPTPFLYACLSAGTWPDPDYVVRTAGDPGATMEAIRGLTHQLAPNRAVFGLSRLETVVSASLEQPRLSVRFLAMFAGFATLLAAVGLYCLVSLMVAARTREMGVRIALGARPSQIAGLVLAATGKVLGWGAAAGLGLIWAVERLLKSQLFGVSPMDAVTLAATLAGLAAIAALAVWVPVRRAAATDPLTAIRMER